MAAITTLWAPYGLTDNPFFQEELRSDDLRHPVSLFVGRQAERALMQRRIQADRSTRTVIEGSAGQGKTTFANRIKADLAEVGIRSYAKPIRIESTTTRAGFVAEVLRTVLRIRLDAGRTNEEDKLWTRTRRLLEGEDLYGGGVSLMGAGGSVTRGYIAPQAAADSLYEHMGAVLEAASQEFGAPVLLHVNNLENLSRSDAEVAATLILDLRDYLMLPGAHWLFVGTTGTDEAVFRTYKQVDGIVSQPIVLGPLPPADVAEMLGHRYRHLHEGSASAPVPPMEPDAAAALYALYQGDLRAFLILLTQAAEALLGLDGIRPMREDEVRRFGTQLYARLLRERLGEDDYQYTNRILAEHGAREFRVTEISGVTGLSQGAASQLARRLETSKAIRQTRIEGRSTYYRATGEVLVAFNADPAPLLE